MKRQAVSDGGATLPQQRRRRELADAKNGTLKKHRDKVEKVNAPNERHTHTHTGGAKHSHEI